ncbi:helix-turn-helix domain-containing protein [Candidatus Poriferisocius sp.]|uniref:AraC family transcriptional regulator n=1 Tax=Candidatus Poriferisocius sp. TaxID=3101276 RepID=UPI003B5C2E34
MRTGACLQQYSSIDAQAEQLTGFDQHYEQVDSGAFSGAFMSVDGDRVGVFIERTNRALHQYGAGPDDQISAVVLLESPNGTMSNGAPFGVEDVLLVGPGGSYDAVVGQEAVPAVFSLSLALSPALPLQRLAARLQGKVRLVSDSALSHRFRSTAAGVLRSWDASQQSAEVPVEVVQGLMLDLLTTPAAAGGSSCRNLELFRRTKSIMVDSLREQIAISEVASRAGVSRRSIEQAFQDSVGLSPSRFRKLLRLNNARRLLEQGSHRVTEAAMDSGLFHLGRFSAEYFDLFGEPPSHTARRSR